MQAKVYPSYEKPVVVQVTDLLKPIPYNNMHIKVNTTKHKVLKTSNTTKEFNFNRLLIKK